MGVLNDCGIEVGLICDEWNVYGWMVVGFDWISK